jgi:excisionase family DNA binding protein
VSDSLTEAIERAIEGALEHSLPGVVDRLVDVGGPRAYSVLEVADRLNLSEPSVRRLIAAGYIQTVPHLNPARIAARELDEFLSKKAAER